MDNGELRHMERKRRMLLSNYKALHPRDNMERLYVPREEEGKGFASIEDSVYASIKRLVDYLRSVNKD